MFPATIAQFFGQAAEPNAAQRMLQTVGANLGPGSTHLCIAIRRTNYILLLLLYSSDV